MIGDALYNGFLSGALLLQKEEKVKYGHDERESVAAMGTTCANLLMENA